MLHRVTALCGYTVSGTDGEVGQLEDVFFDDRYWVIRHLVVDTHTWISRRRVLIPPVTVRRIDEVQRRVEVDLKRSKIEHSPVIDTDQPVSQQHHATLYDYYGFPYVLHGPAPHGDRLAGLGSGDPDLRSARAVSKYEVRATDAEIGHVEDFLLEEDTWVIRYVVVVVADRERHGPQVLLSPGWVRRVSWEGRAIEVNVSRDAVLKAPEYDPLQSVDRPYEIRLHEHHRMPGYWQGR